MFRTLLKAAIVVTGLVTAAPLMAQQPTPAPAPRAFVARPHRMMMAGPRRRRFRRGRRRGRAMMMGRFRGSRMQAMRMRGMRMRAMRMRYMRNRAMI